MAHPPAWRDDVTSTLSHRLVFVSYAALGAALVATRTVGLDSGLWHDEVVAVVQFVREGPSTILSGPDLSHELFALLAWATTSLVGESEVALRVWSVLPFLAGVGVVTAWLHVRVRPLAGVLFLFLATASPLLLDITRQARGYGLAFLAMGVVVVAALEASRSGSTWAVVAFATAGVLGTWTLPQLGLAFLATGLALVLDPRLRARAAVVLGASLVAIAAFYAPHLGEVRDASRIEDGVQIGVGDLLVSPFHHILTPALIWIDGTVVSGTLTWLPLAVLAGITIAYSPLLRERASALVLCTGVVATLVFLWIAQAFVIPRYLSFLLVPLLVLVASGIAEIVARLRTRPAIVGTVAAVLLVGLATLSFASVVADVLRYPREAYKDAARTAARAPTGTPVLAYLRNPEGLDFYLDRPVRVLEPGEVPSVVCESERHVVYVTQPFGIPEVDIPCLDRPGVELHRHRQYTRGDEMNVWLVPPA